MGRRTREVSLGTGTSFDIEFHTIPYHGDDAFTEKHFVSKRSGSQKGILSLVVRDIDARLFIYADVGQNNRQQQLMQFVGFWRDKTGMLPREVAFDSTFTTYAQLQKLNELGTASSRSEFVPSRSLRRPSRPRPTGGSASTFPMWDVPPEIRVSWKKASAFRMMKPSYGRLPLPTSDTTNQPC